MVGLIVLSTMKPGLSLQVTVGPRMPTTTIRVLSVTILISLMRKTEAQTEANHSAQTVTGRLTGAEPNRLASLKKPLPACSWAHPT